MTQEKCESLTVSAINRRKGVSVDAQQRRSCTRDVVMLHESFQRTALETVTSAVISCKIFEIFDFALYNIIEYINAAICDIYVDVFVMCITLVANVEKHSSFRPFLKTILVNF